MDVGDKPCTWLKGNISFFLWVGTGPIFLSVLFGLLLGHMWLAYWGPIEDLGIWMDFGHVLCTSTGNCRGGHDLHASKHTSARVGMPSLYMYV